MNVKELKELIKDYPDETDILTMDYMGITNDFSGIGDGYYDSENSEMFEEDTEEEEKAIEQGLKRTLLFYVD